MKKVAVAVLVLICVGAEAQIENFNNWAGEVMREQSYAEYDGSPYYIDDWNIGTIYAPDGQKFDGVRMRYNIYEGGLEIIKDGGAILVSNKLVEGFTIKQIGEDFEENLHHFTRVIDDQETNKFYKILHDGETKVLVDYSIDLISITSQGYNSTTKTNRFALSEDYYLHNSKIGYVKFKPKKKDFLEVIDSGKKGDVAKYMSQNKLNVKDDSDLVEVMNYYNTL